MLGGGLRALDLQGLLQFVITALVIVLGTLLLVRRAASKYFVVEEQGFEEGRRGEEGEERRGMSIGGGGGGGAAPVAAKCATCGEAGSKKCSQCKNVLYCSLTCQTKHWKADHKLKCKQMCSSNRVDTGSSVNDACRTRKVSGFSAISLVPARGTFKVLQEPKKILFPYDEFVRLFNWNNRGFPPCGLLNCGNSCFANVILQCLSCTRPVTAYLLEGVHSKECIRKHEDWCFLCELQVHVQRASESLHPFSPINILSRLPNIGGNLGYGRQEDAHEFMRFAIDTMQSICLDEFGGEKAVDPSTQETTLIQYIFGGHLRSQVICSECNMISNRYENMMDLTVEIQGDAESLEECLEQFTAKELLDGENMYKCDGCNDYVKAMKRLTVHQAPNILTIALKRFKSGRFGKLNKRITFPEILDLAPYMSGNGDGTDFYTLYAVVVHVDMLNASFFGHYICYTKDYSGRWYRIDDCKVVVVDVEEVLSQGAYMLFYSRRNARQESFSKPTALTEKRHLVQMESLPLISLKEAEHADDDLCCSSMNVTSGSDVPLDEITFEASLLKDAGHEREAEINNNTSGRIEPESMDVDVSRSSMKDNTSGIKEPESMDVDVSWEVNSVPTCKDVEDVGKVASQPKSYFQQILEEGRPFRPYFPGDALPVGNMLSNSVSPPKLSSEVQGSDSEVPHASSNEDGHMNNQDELINNVGAGFILDSSLAGKFFGDVEGTHCSSTNATNQVHKLSADSGPDSAHSAATFKPGFANGNRKMNGFASVAESEATGTQSPCLDNGFRQKPEPLLSRGLLDNSAKRKPKDIPLPTGTKATEPSASSSANGSRGKQDTLFSPGFLNKPARRKAAAHEAKTMTRTFGSSLATKVNGFSNGYSEQYSAQLSDIDHDGRLACFGNGKGIHPDSDISFNSHGSVDNDFCRNKVANLVSVGHHCQTNGNGSAKQASSCQFETEVNGMGISPGSECPLLPSYSFDAVSAASSVKSCVQNCGLKSDNISKESCCSAPNEE